MNNLPKFSIRNRFALLLAGTALAALGNLSFGAVELDLWGVLTGTASPNDLTILLGFRQPRCCASLLAGAALAVSGAIIQTVLANPLAGPNIIGVNAGAGLFVALGCALFPAAIGLTPLFAFAGAFCGVMVVVGISRRVGASRMTLVLAGVAISSLFSAGIDAVVTFVPDALSGYSDFRIGGLGAVTFRQILPASILIFLALAAALTLAPQMDVLALGADTAKSLGLSVGLTQTALLLLAAALAGSAVSFAGLLGFVGLMVPHMVRRLLGREGLTLLIGSALGGGALLCVCELLSRVVFAPFELPVGVTLSFVGGPFFLWLLFRQKGGRHRD